VIFRPSALVTLQLRFYDEAEALDAPEAERPARTSAARRDTPTSLDDVDRAERELTRRRSELAPAEFEELRADLRSQRERMTRDATSAPGDAPEALSGPSDRRVVLTGILPDTCEIVRNGLVTADTASIEIAHADAPFDPRAIRSAAVEIVVGVVPALDYGAGMGGGTRPDGSLLSTVGRIGEGPPPAGVTRFVGVVDTWGASLSSASDSISISCRDLTALLLDEAMPRGRTVDLSVPLDRGVSEFLGTFPALRGFTVRYGVEGDTAIVPADALPAARRAGGGRARRVPRAAEMKVWDYLSDLAVSLGLVATVEDYEIRFLNPRTFYASRSVARRMVYGRNLEELTFDRKLAGVKVPTVEVRSFDPVLGRTRWARWPTRDGDPRSGVFPDSPPRAARATSAQPSGAGAEDKIQTFPISGFSDPTSLERAAESIWQQIGRQELEGSFSTDDVQSYESEAEADLLALRAGDAVELLIASQDAVDVREQLATAGVLAGLSVAARTRYLERLGYRPSVAEALARLQETASQFSTFRVDTATISFSKDEGISIGVEFRNFLIVEDQRPPAASPPSSASRARMRGPIPLSDFQSAAAQLQAEAAELTAERAAGRISEEEYARRSDSLLLQSRNLTRQLRSQS
jgi:hypothetical protein